MSESRKTAPRVRFGRFSIPVPASRWQRVTLGIALCVGGCLAFLPVLGLWMLPLGLMILSIEFHVIRRFRRRTEVWYGRWRAKHPKKDKKTG